MSASSKYPIDDDDLPGLESVYEEESLNFHFRRLFAFILNRQDGSALQISYRSKRTLESMLKLYKELLYSRISTTETLYTVHSHLAQNLQKLDAIQRQTQFLSEHVRVLLYSKRDTFADCLVDNTNLRSIAAILRNMSVIVDHTFGDLKDIVVDYAGMREFIDGELDEFIELTFPSIFNAE